MSVEIGDGNLGLGGQLEQGLLKGQGRAAMAASGAGHDNENLWAGQRLSPPRIMYCVLCIGARWSALTPGGVEGNGAGHGDV